MSRFEEYRQGFVNNVRRSLRFFDRDELPRENVDPKVKRGADFAFRVVLLSYSILLLVYLSFFIAVGVLSSGDDDFSRLAFAAAPQWMIILLYTTLAVAIVKTIIGTIGVLRSNRIISLLSLVTSALIIFAFFTLIVAVLLRGGGSDVIATEIDATTMADEVIQNIVRYGISDLAAWEDFQQDNNCCGVNLKAFYFPGLFGNTTLDEFMSAPDCVLNANVQTILDEEPVFSENMNTVRVDEDGLLSTYFCEDQIILRLRTIGNATIPVLALPIFFEVLGMFYISTLMSRYTIAEGGMKSKHRKVTAPAPKLEPTILKKAGWEGYKVEF